MLEDTSQTTVVAMPSSVNRVSIIIQGHHINVRRTIRTTDRVNIGDEMDIRVEVEAGVAVNASTTARVEVAHKEHNR